MSNEGFQKVKRKFNGGAGGNGGDGPGGQTLERPDISEVIRGSVSAERAEIRRRDAAIVQEQKPKRSCCCC
jgi:hypothetical protein